MKIKKRISLVLSLVMLLSSGCGLSGVSSNTENVSVEQEKSTGATSLVEESTYEQETTNSRIELPSKDKLTPYEQQLLLYVNRGFSLSHEDRTIYYLGKPIAKNVSICVDKTITTGKWLWTVTDDFCVYYRGDNINGPGHEESAKWLKKYDIKTGEDQQLREWSELEKYGDGRLIISDGKNIFIVFKGADRYNFVQIDEKGNDSLLSTVNDNIYDSIDWVSYDPTGKEYQFYVYGEKPHHENSLSVDYKQKYMIDFRTGKKELIEDLKKEIGDIWIPWNDFMPNNKRYYAIIFSEEDELTGYNHKGWDFYEYDKETGNSQLIGRYMDEEIDKIEERNKSSIKDISFVTEKYIFTWGIAIDLNDGKLYAENEVSDVIRDILKYKLT